MCDMWQTKIGWDDPLPDPLATSFRSLLDAEKLQDFSVSRLYSSIQYVTSRILIGLSDAVKPPLELSLISEPNACQMPQPAS